MSTSLLYNVTVHVENSIKDEWVDWMKKTHIPDVMATGMFEGFHFSKILADSDDGGTSFAILYIAKDKVHYERYQSEFATALQKDHQEKYKDKALAFRTLMEQIDSLMKA